MMNILIFRMKKPIFTLAFLSIFVFQSCQKDNGTRYNDVSLIINTSCAVAGCHVSPANAGSLECSSYASMKAVLDNGRFEQRVLIDQNMPPNGTLSDSDLDLLRSWRDNQFRE